MASCENVEERDCKKIFSCLSAKYFYGNTLCSGNVTDFSESCICINTHFCFPLNTKFDMLLPLKEEVLTLPVKVQRLDKENGAYNIMCVEVLKQSKTYLEFAKSFSLSFTS
jgi:hypothetical protein